MAGPSLQLINRCYEIIAVFQDFASGYTLVLYSCFYLFEYYSHKKSVVTILPKFNGQARNLNIEGGSPKLQGLGGFS